MAETYDIPDKRRAPEARIPAPRTSKWAGVLPDKFVATLVDLVSTDRLTADVAALAAFHTRHTFSTHIAAAADHLVARFHALGHPGASKRAWTRSGHTGQNVVAIKPGVGPTPRTLVLGAHYDSRMATASDATSRAPGADDNASGVAAVLEIARLLADVDLVDTVHFVCFSGEEQGLWGSTEYATQLTADGVTVHRMINLDMIGHPPADGSITVERDTGNAVPGNDAASLALGAVMSQAATDYTTLPVVLGPIYASDYMPFEARGWVTVGAYEGEGNPHYHETSDDVGTLDYGYLTQVTRMVLATLLQDLLVARSEATSGVDLFIRDSATDAGTQPSGVPHWTSPDIWVRNDGSAADNPELGHQPPINGQPNYIHVRVGNRGTLAAPAGTARVKVLRCDPGTGMIWPRDFTPVGELPLGAAIAPGASARIGPFTWTPAIVDHECLIAIVSVPGDSAVPDVIASELNHGLLVRYDNNVGQRNVAPVMSVPGGKQKVSLWARGGVEPTENVLVVDAGAMPADTEISVRVPSRLLTGAGMDGFTVTEIGPNRSTLSVGGRTIGRLTGVGLDAADRVPLDLTIDFSHDAEHLHRYPLVFSQDQNGVPAGKETIEITAVKEVEDMFFGNARTLEVHVVTCQWWPQISSAHKVPFFALADAVARGYNGCRYCLPQADTG